MAVTGKQVSVGTSATSIHSDATGVSGARIKIANRGGTSVFLGGSGVTTGTGYELPANEVADVELGPGEELFGIVATGTEAVHVLVTND